MFSPIILNLGLGFSAHFISETCSLSGEGAREDDLLGGLDVGREEPLDGGREDFEGPDIEEFRELCRDPSYFILSHIYFILGFGKMTFCQLAYYCC